MTYLRYPVSSSEIRLRPTYPGIRPVYGLLSQAPGLPLLYADYIPTCPCAGSELASPARLLSPTTEVEGAGLRQHPTQGRDPMVDPLRLYLAPPPAMSSGA